MITGRAHLGIGVGALVFALLCLFSGFDRMSEQRPAFARFVPAPFASLSLTRQAADTLVSGDARQAEGVARAAVLRDPLNAQAMGFLGAALHAQGNFPEAHAAFLQADRLSRREPLSQIYLFEQEIALGSYSRAAERLDLFLRAVNGKGIAQAMLAIFEERAGDSSELARRLIGNPRWAEAYLKLDLADLSVLRQRAAFLSREDEALDGLGCDVVRPMIAELARRNLRREAEDVTLRHCPKVPVEGPIADPEFDAFGDEEAPIGWRRYRSGDVRVSRLAGDGARVELENRSSVTRLVLSQPVALAPGTYLLRAKVDGPGGEDLVAAIHCTTPSRPRVGRERIDRKGQRVVAPACPDAVLSLWLRPGAGRVVVDSVELNSLTP